MIDVDKLVEESNGDVETLYNKLLEEFDGNTEKVNEVLDRLITQEETRLDESIKTLEQGKEYIHTAANIEATREDKAYWTQRDYYKTLYHGKESEIKTTPRTKAAKDKIIAQELANKQTAIKDYYATHPTEASEDNITPL